VIRSNIVIPVPCVQYIVLVDTKDNHVPFEGSSQHWKSPSRNGERHNEGIHNNSKERTKSVRKHDKRIAKQHNAAYNDQIYNSFTGKVCDPVLLESVPMR
jgi:hypothetical protein